MNAPDRERRLLESVPTGLLIGGEWRESLTGKRFAVNDPATGAILTTVADASADAVTIGFGIRNVDRPPHSKRHPSPRI